MTVVAANSSKNRSLQVFVLLFMPLQKLKLISHLDFEQSWLRDKTIFLQKHLDYLSLTTIWSKQLELKSASRVFA